MGSKVPVARVLKLIEPVRLRAEVVHGFGRGSRQLGFPTANLQIRWDALSSDSVMLTEEEREVLAFARNADTGIYCAFGRVEKSGSSPEVHAVAMSMGWNPTFADVKAKTIEPWILHKFTEDFYGSHLRLVVLGYIRPELKFNGIDELIREISADGDFCRRALESAELAHLKADPFLHKDGGSRRPGGNGGAGGAGAGGSSKRTAGDSGQGLAGPAKQATSSLIAGVSVGSGLQAALRELPPLGPDATRLFLVRHGETFANEQGFLSGGGNDCELNARGWQQAEQLAEALASVHSLELDLIGSSTLRRAVSSADTIARRFPKAARLALDDLREMYYGVLEGLRIADSRAEMGALALSWRSGETRRPVGGPGGESPEQLANRTLLALSKLLSNQKGRSVLLVCHSWVNKALIAAVAPGLTLKDLLDVPQRNCAVNIVDFRCPTHDGVSARNVSSMASPTDEDVRNHFEVLGVDLLAMESLQVAGSL